MSKNVLKIKKIITFSFLNSKRIQNNSNNLSGEKHGEKGRKGPKRSHKSTLFRQI
jgi:hypothetical protein